MTKYRDCEQPENCNEKIGVAHDYSMRYVPGLNCPIKLDEYRVHKVSEVICVKCGKRWISVRPVKTLLKELECENCGRGFVIETGEEMNDG